MATHLLKENKVIFILALTWSQASLPSVGNNCLLYIQGIGLRPVINAIKKYYYEYLENNDDQLVLWFFTESATRLIQSAIRNVRGNNASL